MAEPSTISPQAARLACENNNEKVAIKIDSRDSFFIFSSRSESQFSAWYVNYYE
jgi:hypothetical protein